MTEQRERMERALRGCAKAGVPETVDLWPGIKERVDGRVLAEPRALVRPGPVPRTRVRWVLAALAVLMLSTGAYAARDALYETFREELPGARGPVYGEKLNMTRTAGGARVTLGWAYADEQFVVVGFDVEDLKGGRRVAGQPADLLPVQISEDRHGRMEKKFPEHVDLTDERGAQFWSVGGQQRSSVGLDNTTEGPYSISAVFEAEGSIKPGGKHRFRLEVPLQEEVVAALPPGERRWPEPELVGEPFVFDFEVPVRPAPVAEVGQKDTAGGLTLTLERVSNSPARPQAVFCFAPPDDEHAWFPTGGDLEYGGRPVAGKGHCLETLLNKPLEGRSTVTVAEIEGIPHCPSGNDMVCRKLEETIRGPWRFEFEAPAP